MSANLDICKNFFDICQSCDSQEELLFKMAVLDVSVPDFSPLVDAEVWLKKHRSAFASQYVGDCHQMFSALVSRVRTTILHEYGKTSIKNLLKQFEAQKKLSSFHDAEFMCSVLSMIANSSSGNKTFVKLLMASSAIIDSNLTQDFKTIEARALGS